MPLLLKYPLSSSSQKDPQRKSHKKYGYTQSEIEIFRNVAEGTGLLQLDQKSWTRHPLSFLVEAADDICYTIIDLEDATRLGIVPIETTRSLLSEIIGDAYDEKRLLKISDLNEQLALLRAMAIGKLINACQEVFLKNEVDILKGNFDDALINHTVYREAIKKIIKLSIEKIYRSRQVIQREAVGFEVMEKLMMTFCLAGYYQFFDKDQYSPRHQSMYRLLPEDVRSILESEDHTVYQTLQIIIDYLSGLTDRSALKLHRIITGQIPVF